MSDSVVIVDYGSGNLRSAENAFSRVAGTLDTPPEIVVSGDPEAVRRASRLVLPGVGAFADCMAGLRAVPGMVEALEERVIRGGTPFLGVCVGMQLMAETGREKGDHAGLGWIKGAVDRIEPEDPSLKVPHMGWNTLSFARPHPVLRGILDGADGLHAYFVHSYHMRVSEPESLIATTDYGMPVTAIVGRDNMVGAQFHPEKSQTLGLTLLAHFLEWRP